MKTWQIGKKYFFVPSGDSTGLLIQITGHAREVEAVRWFENTYQRSVIDQPFHAPFYKAIVLKEGQDADITHHSGDIYYVSKEEYNDECEIVQ